MSLKQVTGRSENRHKFVQKWQPVYTTSLSLAYSILLLCISKRLINSSWNQHNKYRIRSLNTTVRQAFARHNQVKYSAPFSSVRSTIVSDLLILSSTICAIFQNIWNFRRHRAKINPEKALSWSLFIQLANWTPRETFCRRFHTSCFSRPQACIIFL